MALENVKLFFMFSMDFLVIEWENNGKKNVSGGTLSNLGD